MSIISVVVPVYKVEKYLSRCVESILQQTFTDFDLIFVDDGSPDNCGAICDAYAKRDSRITVIHQKNAGLSGARNAGIDWAFANSNSEWITFVDSDDWVHSDYLKRLLEATEVNGASISSCAYIRTDGEMPPLQKNESSLLSVEDFWCKNRTNATIACAKLYRKELFKSVRYPVGKIHEDEFVTYRLLFSCQKIAFVSEPLYCYFENPQGITGVAWSKKNMVILTAFRNQLAFFTNNGYEKAAQCSFMMYFSHYKIALKELSKNKNRNRYRLFRLKRQMQITVIQYAIKAGFSVKKDDWLFSEAFPLFAKIYYSLLNKGYIK